MSSCPIALCYINTRMYIHVCMYIYTNGVRSCIFLYVCICCRYCCSSFSKDTFGEQSKQTPKYADEFSIAYLTKLGCFWIIGCTTHTHIHTYTQTQPRIHLVGCINSQVILSHEPYFCTKVLFTLFYTWALLYFFTHEPCPLDVVCVCVCVWARVCACVRMCESLFL